MPGGAPPKRWWTSSGFEGDAQELPFADASFDRVTSTFGAMFALDHGRAGEEMVRVCRPGGRIAMTTWVDDGFVGEMFTLTGSFLPGPPSHAQPPPLWGVEAHINDVFGAAGVRPSIERQVVEFVFESVDDAVEQYADNFGPLVSARAPRAARAMGCADRSVSGARGPIERG